MLTGGADEVADGVTLAVTSSTSVVGVAVGRVASGAVEVLSFNQVDTERRHAEEITPLLQRTLAEASVGVADLDRFAVDVGPGRFTGLRVGLATVRTLALALDRPVVGLTSLEILAAGDPERPLLAVIDARRAEVFQQLFGPDGPLGDAEVGPPDALATGPIGAAGPDTPAVVVGDGADRYAEVYGSSVRPGRVPSAAAMIGLSARRRACPGREVTPLYLRRPDVNVNVKTRHTSGTVSGS